MEKEILSIDVDNKFTELFMGIKIDAHRITTVYKDEKGKIKTERVHVCSIRNENKNKFLNLGECWDGGKFQSVQHAVNEAKWFIRNRADIYGWK